MSRRASPSADSRVPGRCESAIIAYRSPDGVSGPVTEASDPPSPDVPAGRKTGSGPAEVPVAVVVAARKGDPAAFAQILEQITSVGEHD